MMIGSYATSHTWPDAIRLEQGSEVAVVSQIATPQVAIGLTMLDISNKAGIRIWTSVTNVGSSEFMIKIGTWADTVIYNAAMSWLALEADDPYFQIGVFDSEDVRHWDKPGNVIHRVNFPRTFESQPKVVVGIRQLDISGNWQIRVYATDIDTKGFTIHAITWGNTNLHSVQATWIAFPASKDGVWSGSFSSEDSPGDFSGQADFGATFSKTPSVFMALTEFNISHDKNLRVKLGVDSVTTSSLSWSISTWEDSVLHMVRGVYVALEM
jgi:hypothetical protein